jgi:exopolysaccharide biosynthesis polyprenyl glycosylphosphotransferase
MSTSSRRTTSHSKLKENARLIDTGVRLFDLGVWIAAIPVALRLRDLMVHGYGGPYPVERYATLATATLLTWLLAAWLHQVYDVYRLRPLGSELGRLLRAGVTTGVGITALTFLAKHQQEVSRLFLVLFVVLAMAVLITGRTVLRYTARSARRRGFNGHVYAVVGTGALAEQLVERFATHPQWGYTFAGHVAMDAAALAPRSGPVLGRLSDLGTILEDHVLDEIVFAVTRDRMNDLEDAIATCEELGVGVRICLDMFHSGPARMSVEDVAGLPTLALTRTPTSAVALAVKRVFDVAGSLAALLLLSPILAATALAVRLDSPGPVFFRQRRVGQNGRTFDMLKFRSMYADAEQRLESLRAFNEMSGPVFKMTNDPRISRVGRFIRRTSIDELPQFWNVLRGEMSVVGPRPPVPSEVKQYKRWQRRRLSVKPGITCTWQVSGRNEINFDQWMELDLAYIDNWSIWRDVSIVARTIPAVLKARGAS